MVGMVAHMLVGEPARDSMEDLEMVGALETEGDLETVEEDGREIGQGGGMAGAIEMATGTMQDMRSTLVTV